MTNYLTDETLWMQVENKTRSALASGSLQSIPTTSIGIVESGITFQVRIIDNLERKSQAIRERVAQKPLADGTDPFLPYDENLYVGELSPDYRCLLNKFNVINGHILLVTTRFEEQQSPLTVTDFETAQMTLKATPGLVFYNGGAQAGASVRHKHLQMIPSENGMTGNFPLAAKFEATLATPGTTANLLQCPFLPFPHRIARSHFPQYSSSPAAVADLRSTANENFHLYCLMLEELGLTSPPDQLSPPHNMLISRHYLWVIPRSRDSCAGIPVNALGFSGAILLRDRLQLELVQRIGILELLRRVVV